MRSCSYLGMDDHPCPNEGVRKFGTKWICQDHAEEHDGLDDEIDECIDEMEVAENCE